MLTLFSTATCHNDVIQRNVLKSWTLLGRNCEIIILGDDPRTAETAQGFGVRHIGGIETDEFGTPLINSIFGQAQAPTSYPLIGYVKADIILMDGFLTAVERAVQAKPQSLMVGRRRNLDVENALGLPFLTGTPSPLSE